MPRRRHHLVPQFLLRGFADSDEQLMMVPRVGGESKRISVARACAETSFYQIEVADDYQDEVDGVTPQTIARSGSS